MIKFKTCRDVNYQKRLVGSLLCFASTSFSYHWKDCELENQEAHEQDGNDEHELKDSEEFDENGEENVHSKELISMEENKRAHELIEAEATEDTEKEDIESQVFSQFSLIMWLIN